MTCRYNNWQLAIVAMLLLAAITTCGWLKSDLRLQKRIAGKSWSYQRETFRESTLASLILDEPINSWSEQGSLRLLSNSEAQLDLKLQLEQRNGQHAVLRIAIQGRWLLSDGFLILKSGSYSALPLNENGKTLLEQQPQAMKDIWLTQFNRSRPIVMLDEHHILLRNDGSNFWVLSNQDSLTPDH
jgi:hypothetical protein